MRFSESFVEMGKKEFIIPPEQSEWSEGEFNFFNRA